MFRLQVEEAKLNLTNHMETYITLPLHSSAAKLFQQPVSWTLFEDLNFDLFRMAVLPIDRILEAKNSTQTKWTRLSWGGGGGSTRIP